MVGIILGRVGVVRGLVRVGVGIGLGRAGVQSGIRVGES